MSTKRQGFTHETEYIGNKLEFLPVFVPTCHQNRQIVDMSGWVA